MRQIGRFGLLGLLALLAGGCPATTTERNPFLTLTETFGLGSGLGTDSSTDNGAGGAVTTSVFRRTMNVTLANNSGVGRLRVAMIAWVNPSSIRSAEQQDALFAGGYVQLRAPLELGSAISLAVGTFVLNGPGTAGATIVRLSPGNVIDAGDGEAVAPSTREFTVIAPDGILFTLSPPVSCDSVGFVFEEDGEQLPSDPVSGVGGVFAGSLLTGAAKTLGQFDVYECNPLRPGLFLKIGGGAKQPNEFFEGEDVRVDFFRLANAAGDAAIVTISQ